MRLVIAGRVIKCFVVELLVVGCASLPPHSGDLISSSWQRPFFPFSTTQLSDAVFWGGHRHGVLAIGPGEDEGSYKLILYNSINNSVNEMPFYGHGKLTAFLGTNESQNYYVMKEADGQSKLFTFDLILHSSKLIKSFSSDLYGLSGSDDGRYLYWWQGGVGSEKHVLTVRDQKNDSDFRLRASDQEEVLAAQVNSDSKILWAEKNRTGLWKVYIADFMRSHDTYRLSGKSLLISLRGELNGYSWHPSGDDIVFSWKQPNSRRFLLYRLDLKKICMIRVTEKDFDDLSPKISWTGRYIGWWRTWGDKSLFAWTVYSQPEGVCDGSDEGVDYQSVRFRKVDGR